MQFEDRAAMLWLPFSSCAAIVRRHWYLARALFLRELFSQYAGQALGAFWTFVHPFFLIILFIFIFVIVLGARIEQSVELPRDYTSYILAGLIPWLGISTMLSKGTISLTSQESLVKQVVFPIELSPIVATLAASVSQVIGFAILFVYSGVTNQLSVTWLLLPVVFALQLLMNLGLSFVFAVITPYFRDMKEIVQLFTTMGVYFLPVVYLPTWVPPGIRPALYFNPFSYPIWCYQDVLYFGQIEHPWSWLVFLAMSLFVFSFGFLLFQRLKPGLGTVL